jgi:serine protease Do
VEGIGFAIPSATVKDIVEQIIHQGYVSGRPTLGISGESLSTFYQHYYRLPAGLYITEVAMNSPAYQTGIEPGDLLLQVDDSRIITMEDLNAVLYRHQIGDTVNVVIYRAGQRASVNLTLTEDKG